MAAAVISSMSPASLTVSGGSATVLAIEDLGFSPGIARTLFGHSANKYPSVIVKPGAAPRIRFRTPFLAAYNLLGFSAKKLTAFDWYLAKFVDYVRPAGAVHTKFGLTASCLAAARITGAAVDQNGIFMAEVDVVPLANDATAHPITSTPLQSLPTLVAEPQVHTLGPFVLNGTRLSGLRNMGIDLGGDFTGVVTDGDRFLRNVAEIAGQPMMQASHEDPFTLLSALGLMGAEITANAVAYFRDVTESSGLILDTGISITVALGSVDPSDVALKYADMASTGFSLCGLSADQTHPFVVATGVALPAA